MIQGQGCKRSCHGDALFAEFFTLHIALCLFGFLEAQNKMLLLTRVFDYNGSVLNGIGYIPVVQADLQ